MSHILRLRLASAAFAVFAVTPLTAGTLTYTDRPTWLSDSTAIVNLDFSTYRAGNTGPGAPFTVGSNVTSGSQVFYNNATGYVTSDFQVIGNSNASFALRQAFASGSQSFWNWGTDAIVFSNTTDSTTSVSMRINFRSGNAPTPVSAFGLSLGLGGGTGASGNITITPQGLGAQTVTTFNQASGLKFFGVSSDTQTFSYFDITITDPSGRYIVLDNLSSGSSTITTPPPPPPPSEIPDPATLLCVGSGLAYLGYLRRNRQLTVA